jgi:hypothetical protein
MKEMYLDTVARPIYDVDDECVFDGKIGIFPFIEGAPAQRASYLRPRGTIITRPVPVNKDRRDQDFLVNKVVPATIKVKWGTIANRNILVQQDGASGHINKDDLAFVAAGSEGTCLEH